MPDQYSKAIEERTKHVNTLVESPSQKKVVVAGPGTGKTYLFSKVLHKKQKTLTLTFVNSLVEDLSLELCGLSDVKILHSYARSVLSRATGKKLKIFSKLSLIIRNDAKIILDQDINFDWIFNQRDESKKDILEFYKQRRKYYDYYGFSDIIYTAVLSFEKGDDKIPEYDQIVVDEFQDFNKLEVDFINLLSKKSPVLLAGDDDQALYQFKGSSNQFIRDRFNNTYKGYDPFILPFCARCPKVIVEATNDFIYTSKSNGHLQGRIDKPFLYFDCPDKDRISAKYPLINHAHVYEKQIPWFIETKIAEIANDIKGKFSVLIISPYKKKTLSICSSLKRKGLQNIDFEIREDERIGIIDGLKILLGDKHDNLGWRIVTEFMMHPIKFSEIITKSYTNPEERFEDILPIDLKKNIKHLLTVVNYINKKKPVNEDSLNGLCETIGINSQEIIVNHLYNLLESNRIPSVKPEIRKIPIKGTTIQSAKGLAADLVFITHFDDQYFIQHKDKKTISDQDICNFLVSITRAKQSLFLISTDGSNPTFLNWISKKRINFIKT
jgi:superfamily I DNA/RNA helicase